MKVRTSIRAGGRGGGQHAQTLIVKTGVKADSSGNNHGQAVVVRRCCAKPGRSGRCRRRARVSGGSRAGNNNHGQAVRAEERAAVGDVAALLKKAEVKAK